MPPVVQDAILTYRQDEQDVQLAVDSAGWFAWLEAASSFAFTSAAGHFTARREQSGHHGGGGGDKGLHGGSGVVGGGQDSEYHGASSLATRSKAGLFNRVTGGANHKYVQIDEQQQQGQAGQRGGNVGSVAPGSPDGVKPQRPGR